MKGLRFVVGAALLLTLAVPAWANNINVIFDPFPTPPGGGTNLYYLTPGVPEWSVSWQPCMSPPNGPIPPSGPGSGLIGDVACLGFANYTGADLSTLSLTFTASGALDGLQLTCSNADSFLATNNCGDYSSPLVDGQVVSLTFSGPLNVPPNYDFFFGVTSDNPNLTGMPDSSLTVPTFDPSTLVLLVSGLGLFALLGLRKPAQQSIAG